MWIWNIYKKKDDAGLLKAVAKGDEAAAREFLNRYQTRVMNFAYRFLGDEEESRDIAQETFLRLFKVAETCQVESGLKSFVFKIARNLCIDYLRKKRPETLENVDILKDEKTLIDVLVTKEKLVSLNDSIRLLPENQRTAILLRHSEDLAYAEIAEVMSVSVSAVESLLVRGRKFLRGQGRAN